MNGIIDSIGNTPLVRLKTYDRNNVFAKVEGFNPGGSIKDRAALYMLREINDKGKTIVEATSGNTGIAISMIGAYMGMPVIIVMPENMSEERIKMMKAYGAKVILTKKEDGMAGQLKKLQN